MKSHKIMMIMIKIEYDLNWFSERGSVTTLNNANKNDVKISEKPLKLK